MVPRPGGSAPHDPDAAISLVQLRYAVALDTHRHFERAATACRIAQPTLSIQLRRLETALGVTLFDRTRTPVVPTDVGTILLAQARVILGEAARLRELRDAHTDRVAGELRLAVIPTLAPYLLPAVLELVATRHPDIELIVEERVTDLVIEGLRDERIDAGLIASSVAAPGLVTQVLFHEPFVGYVGAGHRLAGRRSLAADDLALDDLLLLTDGHCLRTQAVALCGKRGRRDRGAGRASRHPLVRFESGNLETLRHLVERGAGMTLLPMLATASLASDAQRQLVIPFVDPAPRRSIRLVRRRRHVRQALVKAVVAIIREVASETLE